MGQFVYVKYFSSYDNLRKQKSIAKVFYIAFPSDMVRYFNICFYNLVYSHGTLYSVNLVFWAKSYFL